MNERIKELALQAITDVDYIHFDEAIDQELSQMYIPDIFAEKFAELIVKECLDIVNNHPIDSEDMPHNMRIIPYMVEVQEKMKLHFGVEE